MASQGDLDAGADAMFDSPFGGIRVLPGATATAASFQFDNEDHSLGNALRYAIMKNPAVDFCGYSIPHPSENKMNLRIQLGGKLEGQSVYQALEKGLDDLTDMCDAVLDKFQAAREKYDQEHTAVDAQSVAS